MKHAGLRWVVWYKEIKAVAQLLGFGLLLGLELSGKTGAMHALARGLSENGTHALTRDLSRVVTTLSTPVAIRWIQLALLSDGLFSGFEGYALRKGWVWAPWMVIAATSALVPFEIRELVVRGSLTHAVILVVNLAIAGFLVTRQLRET